MILALTGPEKYRQQIAFYLQQQLGLTHLAFSGITCILHLAGYRLPRHSHSFTVESLAARNSAYVLTNISTPEQAEAIREAGGHIAHVHDCDYTNTTAPLTSVPVLSGDWHIYKPEPLSGALTVADMCNQAQQIINMITAPPLPHTKPTGYAIQAY